MVPKAAKNLGMGSERRRLSRWLPAGAEPLAKRGSLHVVLLFSQPTNMAATGPAKDGEGKSLWLFDISFENDALEYLGWLSW